MSLSQAEQDMLGRIYRALEDRPLEPNNPLYQPVYDSPGCEDPVALMQKHIAWSGVESIQMFSGFRGSGKTTELLRLRKRLGEQGVVVLYSNALDYLNPAEPIEITDLLVILAGAFGDAVCVTLNEEVIQESYWARLTNYLTRAELSLPQGSIKTDVENPLKALVGGLKAGVDLKLELKTTPSFRSQLQQVLATRLGELKGQVDRFIEDGVKAIQKARGEETQVVFIFDSLEQIRGSLSTEEAVIRSVERVFANHLSMLKLPYVHVVYTVPPWLQFVMPNSAKITMVPTIRQWDSDAACTPCDAGWDALRALVGKRFGAEECRRVFGEPDAAGRHALADQLVAVCGGHFRDLFLLLRETLLRVDSLPVTPAVLKAGIQAVRGRFLPIAIDDARWLDQIARLRTTALPANRPEDVQRLTRFLDTHFVLYLKNGEIWYDVHPLIRDEVAEIARQSPAPADPGQQPA